MKSSNLFAVLICLSTLVACATPEKPDTLVLSGKVIAVREVGPTKGDAGAYRPGMGGAVGGVVAGLIVAATSTSSFFVYTIQLKDGSRKDVNSVAAHRIGDCVAVYAVRSKGSIGNDWNPNEVSITPSESC